MAMESDKKLLLFLDPANNSFVNESSSSLTTLGHHQQILAQPYALVVGLVLFLIYIVALVLNALSILSILSAKA